MSNDASVSVIPAGDTPVDEKVAARMLGLSVETVRKWRQHGRGPRFLKLSPGRRGAVRYALADIEAFLAAARVGG